MGRQKNTGPLVGDVLEYGAGCRGGYNIQNGWNGGFELVIRVMGQANIATFPG